MSFLIGFALFILFVFTVLSVIALILTFCAEWLILIVFAAVIFGVFGFVLQDELTDIGDEIRYWFRSKRR